MKFILVNKTLKKYIQRFCVRADFIGINFSIELIEMIEQDAFLNLKQEKYIDFSYNMLNFIVFKPKNLHLNLSFNQLTNFDSEFIDLENFVNISISNNKF